MARILIVGGGCRGLRFAERMAEQGHAVRATTRGEGRRAAIEATGAECWIGTPDRLATLRGALANVTVACWMLACARGSAEQIAPLHSSRLEFFLSQAIDTTARGLIYDACAVPGGTGPSREMLADGARIFRSLTELNAIPAVVLGGEEQRPGAPQREGTFEHGEGERSGGEADRAEDAAWVDAACDAVAALLGGGAR